ncbi:hypothetical protein LO771_05315 [Streptacidiphilus sp. ASG 303]|uniref:hypothetical protein n=1 Tax=Streptacidiphilus sp. ASG 303 TaxID=2896847 RepID=UPI001E612776|nr:hypothetical protein [Streptacidiphilus sp. ASG 303]MCD0481846.1 hypothetical protein [Streptacidiphilus sp. ASG 303]
MSGGVRSACRGAAVVVLLGASVAACGIRPTAVPVDAGAPASRTACPTAPADVTAAPSGTAVAGALAAPFAAKQPTAAGSPTAFGPAAPPTARPSATPGCLRDARP